MNQSITGFTLPDVLMLVAMQGLTGELEMESGNNIGSILFHEGRILHALSPYSCAIGDLLVKDGLITEAELIETLKLQKAKDQAPLGYLFLQSGKVSYEVVERMVHEQIREAVKEFTSWNRLSFGFVEKDIQPYDRIHLAVTEFIPFAKAASAKLFLQDIISHCSSESATPPTKTS